MPHALHLLPSVVIKEIAEILKCEEKSNGSLASLDGTNRTVSEIVRPVLWSRCKIPHYGSFRKLKNSQCLAYIRHLEIGCGIAGGDWELDRIVRWSQQMFSDPGNEQALLLEFEKERLFPWDTIAGCTILESLIVQVIRSEEVPTFPPSTTHLPRLRELTFVDTSRMEESRQDARCQPALRPEDGSPQLWSSCPVLETLHLKTTLEAVRQLYSQLVPQETDGGQVDPVKFKGFEKLQTLELDLFNHFDHHLPWDLFSRLCPNVQDITLHVSQAMAHERPLGSVPRISRLPFLRTLQVVNDIDRGSPDDLRPLRMEDLRVNRKDTIQVLDPEAPPAKTPAISFGKDDVEDILTAYAAEMPRLESIAVGWSGHESYDSHQAEHLTIFQLAQKSDRTNEFCYRAAKGSASNLQASRGEKGLDLEKWGEEMLCDRKKEIKRSSQCGGLDEGDWTGTKGIV